MPPSRSRQSAIDVIVVLIRAGLRIDSPAHLPSNPPWEEVTAAASAGLVLPALASGARALPGGIASLGEAGSFLAAMEAANAARNERLMQRLRQAAAALEAAGIPAVALKGAVFALQDMAHAPWRFLGDLDLLVPAERIDDAVAALTALSYDHGGVPDLGDELHHHPPLLHADGETVVELHTRLFPSAGNALLPPERLLRMAEPAPAFPGLAVPPAGERMVHLITHAQIANRRFARRTLSLRDALDFAALMRQAEIDLAAVLACFDAEGHGPASAGFMLAANRVLGEPFTLPSSTRSDALWAEAAIASLAAPGGVARRLAWHWFTEGASRLLNRQGRSRAWAGLRDPVRRRHFLQRRLFGWRNIR
jgi:hypothetical protein